MIRGNDENGITPASHACAVACVDNTGMSSKSVEVQECANSGYMDYINRRSSDLLGIMRGAAGENFNLG